MALAGERRVGGKGIERARLNCDMQRWSWARTWRRVRRWGRAGGSVGSLGWEGARVSVGEAGWDDFRLVGEVGSSPPSSSSSGGESMLSRPLGTKCRICGWREPRDESVSARDRASPRRSSTS